PARRFGAGLGDQVAEAAPRVRGPLRVDEVRLAQPVVQLPAGELEDHLEVQVVPGVLVRERDLGRRGARGLGHRDHQRDREAHGAAASAAAARSKSRAVSPPASWVLSASRTVRQRTSMSGWWLAASAANPTRTTNAIASAKPGHVNSLVIVSPSRDQPLN